MTDPVSTEEREQRRMDEIAERWGGASLDEPLTPREEADLRAYHYNVAPRAEPWARYARLFATLDAVRGAHDRSSESDSATPDRADRCAECERQERLLGADPTEEWVADAWAQATPHPHATPDRADPSPDSEGLDVPRLAQVFARALEDQDFTGFRNWLALAHEIAAEYARSTTSESTETKDPFNLTSPDGGHNER